MTDKTGNSSIKKRNYVGGSSKPEKMLDQNRRDQRRWCARTGGQMGFWGLGGSGTTQKHWSGWWMRVTILRLVGVTGQERPRKSRVEQRKYLAGGAAPKAPKVYRSNRN